MFDARGQLVVALLVVGLLVQGSLFAVVATRAQQDSEPAVTPVALGGHEISLDAEQRYAWGVWSDGTTVWVANYEFLLSGAKLYAYRSSDGSRDAAKDFDTLEAAGNTSPRGIWSDGVTMYVADLNDDKLYAYRMSDRSRDSDKDIALGGAEVRAGGVWSDGETIWVASDTYPKHHPADKIFAYHLRDDPETEVDEYGARNAAKDFDSLYAAGNHAPDGIWSDGITMWVLDDDLNKLFAYRMSDRSHDADRDIDLNSDRVNLQGLWSDGSRFLVVDPWAGKISSYHIFFLPECSSVCVEDGGDQEEPVDEEVEDPVEEPAEQPLTSTQRNEEDANPDLTFEVKNQAASHDGSEVVTFELHFSEALPLSFRTLRDHVFDVSGGAVIRAKRMVKGSNQAWTIHVRPSGNGDVTVVLPVTSDCGVLGTICTADGRWLSAGLSLTISGPGGGS